MLANVKDRHRDIERIRHQINGYIRLKDPEENVVSLKFMEIVFLRYHRNQFIAQDKCDDQSRNGDNHRLGNVLDQIEDSGIPSLRCLSHLPGYGSHLLIDRREHVIQTGLDKPDQDILYRFRNSLNDGVHLPLLLREQCCQLWNQGSSQQHDSGTSHQLFDALALCLCVIKK